MAMLKYGNANVVETSVNSTQWDRYKKVCKSDSNVRVARNVLAKYSPKKYLLSHCTIVGAVETELAVPGNSKSDYYIHPIYSSLVNNNGDAWSKKMLGACYRTFIGSNNYLEHVQIPELSKGKVIDAVLREVPIGKDKTGADLTTYYVDILVATERRHKSLVAKIESGSMNSLSMGCKVAFTLCTKCGNKAVDDTEACEHVRFQKNSTFFDDFGVERKVAELCGHYSNTDSVTFIDASWVENPAFTGAVVRNIVAPSANVMAKIEKAHKKESFVFEEGDFLKAASNKNILRESLMGDLGDEVIRSVSDIIASGKDANDRLKKINANIATFLKAKDGDEDTKDAPAEEGEEDAPAEEDNSFPGEESATPEEEPALSQNNAETWKKRIKERLMKDLGDEIIQELSGETDGIGDGLETLDESLIHPTASIALKQMYVMKNSWDNFLHKFAGQEDKKTFEKLKFGTYMILTGSDLTSLAEYGYSRRDFLAVMSFLDRCFKKPLSLGVKKAIAELSGTKGMDPDTAVYSLQKLAGKRLNDREVERSVTWLLAMDSYPA